jgi:hypothetical protein
MLVGGVRSLVDTGGLTYSKYYAVHSDANRQSMRPAQQAWAMMGWDGLGWVVLPRGGSHRGSDINRFCSWSKARHQMKKRP